MQRKAQGKATVREGHDLTTLGQTIRDARLADGLGVRELGRRSGLAASQISRIESGAVERPDYRTLRAIARALGRTSVALGFFDDYLDSEVHRELIGETRHEGNALVEGPADWSQRDLDELRQRVAQDEGAETIARLCEYAHDVFVYVTLGDHVREFATTAHHAGVDKQWLEVHLRDLLGLTDERRDLVAAYVSEQAVLSELDRKGSNPQSVRLEVRRRPTEDAE